MISYFILPTESSGEKLREKERKRKFARKTRTGCLTCKERRVKCDEKRPECAKCLKLGGPGKCGGYIMPWHMSSISKLSIPRVSSQVPILSTSESLYYHHFIQFTQPKLHDFFGLSNWSRPVLQAFQDVSFVKNAVLALAALDKSIIEVTENRPDEEVSIIVLTKNEHHVQALQHFCLAIRQMCLELSSDTKNQLRISLLGCLLTYAFEAWSGRHWSSLKTVQTGLVQLQSWFRKQQCLSLAPPTSSPPITSPKPDTLEDELIHTFARLDINLLSYIETLPPFVHPRVTADVAPELISPIPASGVFNSIEEATLHWQPLINSVWTSLLLFRPQPTSLSGPNSSHSNAYMLNPQDLYPIKHSLAQDLQTRDRHLNDLISWNDAFLPLIQDAVGEEAYHAAVMVLSIKLKIIALHGSFFSDELGYDNLVEEFKAIVWYWKIMSKGAGADWKGKILGNRGVLYMCALKCRDWGVRKETLQLLKNVGSGSAGKARVWDCGMAAGAAELVIGLEQEGLQEGDIIPTNKRVRLLGLEVDLRGNPSEAVVRYMQGTGGGRVVGERRIKW